MQGGGDTVCGRMACQPRRCAFAAAQNGCSPWIGIWARHAKGMPVRSARKRKFEMDAREELCQKLMDIVDIGYDLMAEYDSLPHQYGEVTMYQAESKVIQYIGRHKSATISEIAASNGKTPSAYSQIIRKLKQKGWVEQVRNQHNNREYNLFLTEAGWRVFNDHHKFEQACYARAFQKLEIFTDEELELYCRVQQRLNEAFRLDVEDSYQLAKKK